MKAIKFFVAAMAMAFAVNMNAQSTSEMNQNYNRLHVGYAPTDFSAALGEARLHGFSAGWLGGYNVTKGQLPLYVETGLTMNFVAGELRSDCDKMLNFEVPANLTYRYRIPKTQVRLSPYFGFHFKVTALAIDDDAHSYYNLPGTRRFQFGMQVGANVEFNRFYVGAGWNKDFMPLCTGSFPLGEVKTSGLRVNIGVVF